MSKVEKTGKYCFWSFLTHRPHPHNITYGLFIRIFVETYLIIQVDINLELTNGKYVWSHTFMFAFLDHFKKENQYNQ